MVKVSVFQGGLTTGGTLARVYYFGEPLEDALYGSYGVYVAKLAGLPSLVIKRAAQLLAEMETGALSDKNSDGLLPLFASPISELPASDEGLSALESMMEDINPDSLSPREALALVYELKALNAKS